MLKEAGRGADRRVKKNVAAAILADVSFIKKFRNRRDCVLPDRGTLTMDKPFLKSYVELLIQTCHRRGTHRMGGMAAQIPIRDDPQANETAMPRCARQDARSAGRT